MNHVIQLVKNNELKITFNGILPRCNEGVPVDYCEGRLWPIKNKDNNQKDIINERAFCPRVSDACQLNVPISNLTDDHPKNNDYRYYGARIFPNKDLAIEEWSLSEYLEVLKITPQYPNVNPLELITRLSGWVNRLNEIRQLMKCDFCNSTFVSNLKYSKNLAVYNSTVFTCSDHLDEGEHDVNIYLSHCWACSQIVDSRVSRIQVDGFYLCISCGSGPRNPTRYMQGTICPNCGKNSNSIKSEKNQYDERTKICLNCMHEFRIPGNRILTGSKNHDFN